MFETKKPGKNIKEVLRKLGNKYTIKTIDFENCIKLVYFLLIAFIISTAISNQIVYAATGQAEITLSGTVTNSKDIGIPNAIIEIEKGTINSKNQNRVKVASALTDAGGRYSIQRLSAGTYNIKVSKEGYTAVTRLVIMTDAHHQVQNFKIATITIVM